MGKQTVNPPRGTRDFLPEVQILRKEVFGKIEKIFQKYGFLPIDTPIVEKWETLKGKYGKEAEERLIWRFKLPYSNREFGLRYDLTVPLARFIARFRPSLPFKRYQIGRVYRYDEPQRGRYREFWQCDYDIVGSDSPLADAEILDITRKIFEEFGFKSYTIKLNDRRILRGIFEEELKLDKNKSLEAMRIIDKVDKIGKKEVIKRIERVVGKKIAKKIEEVLWKLGNENIEILDNLEKKFKNKNVKEGVKNLKKIIEVIGEKGIKVELSLARGLGYYTGMIFEVIVKKPKIGSLGGGGRYDNLIKIFAKEKIPAVGGSLGVERLIETGINIGIFKVKKKSFAKVGIVFLEDVSERKVFELANFLREKDINVWVDVQAIEPKKIGERFRKLYNMGIGFGIVVGKEELAKNLFTLQSLETREKIEVDKETLVRMLKE